ncbi:MAG: ABC transporter ATP-binding protein [Actinobacteria bacterium]|nr:MAG: ABC transporter ATP-binding protein [Actinomycetota bacterium]
MSGAESLLRVDGLCSGYGALQVLFEVSFDVRPGEVVALMGSNGAGKTTALKTITGQLKVLRGTVHLDGDDVSGAPAEQLVRRGVAMVPEGRGMLRDLTVAQNLELGAYVVNDRAVVAQALDRAYTAFPILAERREQKAGTLSGGQQQMLSVARALMSGPRLLLVDEASLGLSPVMTETVFDLLAETNRKDGVAVLLVEQSVLALDLADRAFVLEKGQVVDRAEGAAVRAMQGRLREAYLGRASTVSAR